MIVGEFRQMLSTSTNLQNRWGPFVEADLSNSHGKLPPNIIATKLAVLIDTGAEVCFIDSGLVDRIGLQVRSNVQSMVMGTKVLTRAYRAQLVFPLDQTLLELDFAASPMRSGGSNVDILLGMDALRAFRLDVSRKNGRVTLQFEGH